MLIWIFFVTLITSQKNSVDTTKGNVTTHLLLLKRRGLKLKFQLQAWGCAYTYTFLSDQLLETLRFLRKKIICLFINITSRVSIVGWIQTNFGVNNLRILLWKFCSSFCSRGWGGNPNCTNRLKRFLYFSMWMGVAVMQTEGITYINQTWRAHVNSKLKQKILSFASDWLCAVGFLE